MALYIIPPRPPFLSLSLSLSFSFSFFFVSYLAPNFASQWTTLLFRNRAGFVLAASYLDCGFLWFSLVLRSQYSDSLWAVLSGIEPRWCEGFRNRPVQPWGPPFLLYSGHRVSCPAVKRPECGVDHTTHLAPGLKKKESYRPTSTPRLGLYGLF
jgi:hypothetical protein